jgi:putative flippase GtrA
LAPLDSEQSLNRQYVSVKKLLKIQFIRFLLVGCLNTAVGYALFAIGILLGMPSALALMISTAIGVLFNYFSTGRMVFAWRSSRRFWRFVSGYGIIYFINAVSLYGLERMAIPSLLAQGLLLPLIVGLSFLVSKYLVFIPARTLPS